jgi:hypothetical protein
MAFRSVALIGRARSGKDTVAARLVTTKCYMPIAFASPLKTAAEHLNPIISAGNLSEVRLNDALAEFGWEGAKDAFPEVRRILQRMGQTIRDLTPDYWLNLALDKAEQAHRWNAPVVVTDCRYPNEAEALKKRGFLMVRVVRPTLPMLPNEHESETALDSFRTDYQLFNGSTIADLHEQVDRMIGL